jgi:hypothetical protein
MHDPTRVVGLFVVAVLGIIGFLFGLFNGVYVGSREVVQTNVMTMQVSAPSISSDISNLLRGNSGSPRKKGVQEDHCDGIFWFHAPKTGSTLFMALQHVCAPEAFQSHIANITREDLEANERLKVDNRHKPFYFTSNHGSIYFVRNNHALPGNITKQRINIDHNPVRGDFIKPTKQHLAVGMFRDPRARLVSSFLDGAHHEGMHEDDFRLMRRSWEARGLKFANGHPTMSKQEQLAGEKIRFVNEYANHPYMIGCYTKMLNGFMCSSPTLFHQPLPDTNISDYEIPSYNHSLPLNQTAIDIALRRLRQFRFVGLFERFEESVQLLHKILGRNKTQPSSVELFPQRTTSPYWGKLLRDHIRLYDPYDSIVYAEAKVIFENMLREHGMPLTAQ